MSQTLSPKAKIKGYLSLAAKAGKLALGQDAIVQAAQAKSAALLLLDEQAGKNTADRIKRLAAHHEIPLILIEDLGTGIGKHGSMAAALQDKGLGGAILALAGQEEPK
ncbi:MAG: ribosomal L7Ae/L30e/S12e/Gadd45 family protein [Christensenellaceae bacterium]|jgi:ribosomal protein L7Ae-like RNA K-turn-binding protein|nr:ribosomal L7Ae/L30e/S12e/Gadd45 family protein [Christensenellaceae bacterium]